MEVLTDLLTTQEVAQALRCSDHTVRRMVRDKSMYGVRVGLGYRIPADEVKRLTGGAVRPKATTAR
ncbi:MAG TPA: helix-turn-helix domain-containing protein [Chloroflexota bacterium]|nr:helix-turn-helix domain-containing protein [Chloroflexota bacterium]